MNKHATGFLQLLGANEALTFQTFDDNKAKRKYFARVLHGTLAEHQAALERLNQAGSGIFVMVNAGDGKGRSAENVVSVRALFVDLDGSPLEPIMAAVPKPQIVVASSPGHWHAYWLVSDCPLGQFKPLQQALAKKFDGDPKVCDLPRVMRLPGFLHQKGDSYLTQLHAINQADSYAVAQIVAGLELTLVAPVTVRPLSVAKQVACVPSTAERERVLSALASIDANCSYSTWRDVVFSVHSTGWTDAEAIARTWSQSAPDDYDETAFSQLWKSCKPDGAITLGTLFHHAKEAGWTDPNHVDHFTGSGGDVANGKIFAMEWRNKLLFIHETNEVLMFAQAQGWISATHGEADRAAKEVLATLRGKAAERYRNAPDDPKTKRLMAHVERTSKAPNLRAMVEMAKSEIGMTRSLVEFDADPMQLGVVNGVLNLRNGQLLPVSPDLLVSKRCNVSYEPNAVCPQFLKFLADVQPDPEMQEFLQRWAGYSLTGSVQEQKMGFLFGGGANGKSVFVELLAWLLGDYARKIATEMLMHHQRSPQGASPDIVALKGCRFIYANETEEGRRLAESRVKDMTGGDTLTGRVPYGKADINFRPTHKLLVVGNHKPEITDNGFGMWRRVALVTFDVTIPENERDPQLLEKLKTEGAGILNWALEGLRQWQQHGLKAPNKIEAATAAYRDEMDIIGDWLNDHCETGAGCTVKKESAYKAYHNWALTNGHHPLAQVRLTRRLTDRGYKVLSDKRTIGGLALTKMGEASAMRV